jgi:hypothetical protein
LLEDRPDMSIEGVRCQGENRPGKWVRERYCGDESCLGGDGESSGHVWQPIEYLRVARQSGGVKLQNSGDSGKEAAVEIDHT